MKPARFGVCSVLLLATITIAGCSGDDPPTGNEPVPGIRIISGAAAVDTIESYIPPVVFEVRRANGTAARDVEVRIEHSPPITGPNFIRRLWLCDVRGGSCDRERFFGAQLIDSTDGDGKFSVPVRFALREGPAVLKISVPTLGFVDSVTFSVRPGNPASVRATTADTALTIGTSATLGAAQVFDRGSNLRSEAATASAGAGNTITFNASTLQATAQQFGVQTVYFTFNALRDSTILRAVPVGRVLATVGSSATMFNLDGTSIRNLGILAADLGGQPRFDQSRQRVTASTSIPASFFSTSISVIDTTGLNRRDIETSVGLNSILVQRLMPDGSVLAVAQRTPVAGLSIWRVGTDNSLTLVRAVPGLLSTAGSADLSPDGTRLAYGAPAAPTGTLELRIMTIATGSIATVEQRISAPRFTRQGDRILFTAQDGLAIVNVDGTGRRLLLPRYFTGGAVFSPDEAYVIGNLGTTAVTASTHLVRVSDGTVVPIRVRGSTGAYATVYTPDWR